MEKPIKRLSEKSVRLKVRTAIERYLQASDRQTYIISRKCYTANGEVGKSIFPKRMKDEKFSFAVGRY
ncbi:MAG: hypothetical protein IJX87_00990 [Clostridia bacterium]|nr:hypothetical protein [Clostridia bacterium]